MFLLRCWVHVHVEGHSGALLEDGGEGWCGLVACGCWLLWLIADGDAGTESVPGWPGGGVNECFPDGLAGGVGKDGAGDVEDGVAAGDVGG